MASRPTGTPSPLSTDQLTDILARHAATAPLSTTGVDDFCRSRFPHMPISITETTRLLLWLHHQGRVDRWHGSDTHALERAGVIEPHPRRVYWQLRPTRTTPTP